MELRYRREAAVGALIIASAALFVFLMMWLRGQRWGQGELVHVVFNDVAGLKVGDPVRTSGVHVGNVQGIELLGPGRVNVVFDVSEGPTPRRDASAVIKAADLFGARYIEYSPGTAAEPLPEDSLIAGIRLNDMAEMAGELSGRSQRLLDNASDATRELRVVMADVRELLRTLNRGAGGASTALVGALEELRIVLQRTDLLVARASAPAAAALQSTQRAAANVDSLTVQLGRTTAVLDSVLSKVHHGQGLAAALVNDTALVGDLRATNAALRTLLEDIRANPGRYFRLRL
jgi:phospholipid/cholesterol/gamma-HCH transport system substrate-binding protein